MIYSKHHINPMLSMTSAAESRRQPGGEDAPPQEETRGEGGRKEASEVSAATNTEAECIGFHGELALMWRYGCFCFNL